MNLNGTEYYYIRNGQGDIIGLIDGNKNQVVSYTYDSWGKLTSIDGSLKDTLGVKNPYRYRGYRYDTETGLYYLQSRYYNPEWGRFINADITWILEEKIGELLEHNLFSYCTNNYINFEDKFGFSKGSKSKPLNDEWLKGLKLKDLDEMYKKETDPARKQKIKTQQKFLKGRDKQKRQENTRKIEQGVVLIGVAYGIYRFIRFLPSLAPPLWWTVPGNLICP